MLDTNLRLQGVLETFTRQHGIRQKRDDGGLQKTFASYLRRTDESTLSRLLVESSIVLAVSRGNPSNVLKDEVLLLTSRCPRCRSVARRAAAR